MKLNLLNFLNSSLFGFPDLIFLLLLIFSSCIKTACIDQTEPVIYYTGKSSLTGNDTLAISSIGMLSAGELKWVDNDALNKKKIRLSILADSTMLNLICCQNGQTYIDTITLMYERKREYTGSECGFRINITNIKISYSKLHLAKEAIVSSSVPQQLNLTY